jgi:hypothetical protein
VFVGMASGWLVAASSSNKGKYPDVDQRQRLPGEEGAQMGSVLG